VPVNEQTPSSLAQDVQVSAASAVTASDIGTAVSGGDSPPQADKIKVAQITGNSFFKLLKTMLPLTEKLKGHA